MKLSQIETGTQKEDASRLEKGLLELPMEERILASAQRILDKESKNEIGDDALHRHQIPAFSNFIDYLIDSATSPADAPVSPFCRIILPPRTGKTVVAGKIIDLTGLCSTFIVPTRALVHQTREEFHTHLPGVPTGLYFGEQKRPVDNGVNITTYQTFQKHFSEGGLPEAIRASALVFLDEAHHSMTSARAKTIRDAFDEKAIRIALTATPDYNQQKRLRRFFPKLIHELELFEALESGLLAPSRMWVVEVDADASTVRFIAGDYEQETLGRLMSSSPFFKAVEVFRYSGSNKNIPAMVACSSRQQAHDLWAYLKKHKPRELPLPGLILGDTPNQKRARLLENFKNGRLDTIIQVGVLIEGWNAPQCKLLLDLAPSLSRVRATQKYFRVMTRYKDKEARVVVILPGHLPVQPILPIDLLLNSGQNYLCGDLIESADNHASVSGGPVDKATKSPIKSVRLKTRMIASARLTRPKLNTTDLDQIRRVVVSCPDFSLDSLLGRRGFARFFFNHSLFIGSGSALLRHIGIPYRKNAFWAFMAKLFPDKMGKHLIEIKGGSKGEIWRPCMEDFEYIYQAAMEPSDDKGNIQEPFMHTLNALCGGAKAIATPEELLMIKEPLDRLFEIIKKLDERHLYACTHRLGLFGAAKSTFNEIGMNLNISGERARQIFHRAVRIIGARYRHRVGDRYPIRKMVSDYPDLSEILGRRNK